MSKTNRQHRLPSLTNVIWKEGQYYVALCLNYDVSSFGDTYEQALKNLQEAVDLYLDDSGDIEALVIENPSLTVTAPLYA